MSRKASYSNKLKMAARMLFFKRHRQPGVKGWELKKELGNNFIDLIRVLNSQLEKLDLQVKTIFEETELPKKPSEQQFDKARFIITAKSPSSIAETKTSGWRIDDVAALTVTVACIISRQGKMPRREIEKILKDKFPEWKVKSNLDKFIKIGYLRQDENNLLYLDWRSHIEIDREKLLKLILSEELTAALAPT